MTQIGEAVAFAIFDPLTENCPFTLHGEDTSEEEGENPEKDDTDAAAEPQKNNGGVLGENLEKGSPAGWGKAGTINKICEPRHIDKILKTDTDDNGGGKIDVRGVPCPYIVAAHHLIPGKASIMNSELYKRYMKKGGSITTTAGKKYTIKAHIGYNVNGNHNGAWLPGNYAIRTDRADNPTKKTWGVLIEKEPDWCYDYMLACIKQAGGQFHDAHTKYNDCAKDFLNKVDTKLATHQDTECKHCKKEGEIYPPYILKTRLYLVSVYLRRQVTRSPGAWKDPWITSDKFKELLFKAGLARPELASSATPIALGSGS